MKSLTSRLANTAPASMHMRSGLIVIRFTHLHLNKITLLLLVSLTVVSSAGCLARFIGFARYVTVGPPLIPAEFEGLQGKRVAIVCVSAANSFGPNAATSRLTRELGTMLARNVSEIDVVRDAEVADWLDHHDWTNIDYTEVGRGVKADHVVVVELNQPLKLREGPTLFRGLADFTVTVINTKSGEKEFRRRQEEYRWPKQARYGVSENQFEQAFIRRVAGRVGQYFYGIEPNSDIAENTNDIEAF